MHIPEEAPPLNPWPFFLGDGVLIVAAVLIASEAPTPLAPLPLVIAALCLILGALLAVTPFLLNFSRNQEIALAQRQREIAALAQSTANSAEQISNAASSLHTISEATTRALKLADALPHKLQEKINDFKAQLNEVAVTENESLAQEINTLRTSETERLETALVGVRKVAFELAAFETSVRKQFKELNEALQSSVGAASKAASASSETIAAARNDAELSLIAAQSKAISALQGAIESALGRIEERLSQFSRNEITASLDEPQAPVFEETVPSNPVAAPLPLETPASVQPAATSNAAENSTGPEIAIALVEAKTDLATIEPSEGVQKDIPVPAERPAKKRTQKRQEHDSELSLGLDIPQPLDPYNQSSAESAESAVSADGLTRLIVTAYIGIGNKLHVRGEGPGLSWDRGVPLQFVSIGKWRWESAEATGPVTLKIFKNDILECTSVGTMTIEPGHQNEVVANFS